MGLKIGETRCPGCGAMVSFGEGQCQARCEYCGSPVTIDDDQVVRNVDEADLKRAETEQLVRLKELELKEREQEQVSRARRWRAILTAPLVLVLLVSGAICEAAPKGSPMSESFGMIALVCMLVVMLIWIGEILK